MRIPRGWICRHLKKKWRLSSIFRAFFISIISISIFFAALLYFFSGTSTSSHTHRSRFILATDDADTKVSHDGSPEDIAADSDRSSSSRRRHGHHLHLLHKKEKPFFRILPWESTPILSLVTPNKSGSGSGSPLSGSGSSSKCSLFNCLDIHRCGGGRHANKLSIYIYPLRRWEIDGVILPPPSKHFLQIVDALRRSAYWVEDPAEACILFPTIDTLYMTEKLVKLVMAGLGSLPFWGDKGQNHLLFSFSSSPSLLLEIGRSEALLASSAFHVAYYRPGFNIPLMVPNPWGQNGKAIAAPRRNQTADNEHWLRARNFVAVSVELLPPPDDPNILVLDFCKGQPVNYFERCNKGYRVFAYPEVLQEADFCIIWRNLDGPLLWDVMSVGCIPVILVDFTRLPFDDVIDWNRLAILVYEQQLGELPSILRGIGKRRKFRLKEHVELIFDRYFKNIGRQTETVLEVLQDRIFSHHARTLQIWNHHPTLDLLEQPLFNPGSTPGEAGFTAVILAYERVPSLFEVIIKLDKVPSLTKIVVVWNNQKKHPPPYSSWPKTNSSIKVLQMESNKMSNRFFPFDEIETEAVFSLDDDIIMLTTDEVEFGFQTWKEFPERLVGFPSRNHVWDNATKRWRYESEWTNEVSMVLTGAAFYHKYWHHAFTHKMPPIIRDIVDDRMNCEDIAINFLVAATTGQPPIKVTPRKKFKCPTCSNNEMLSSDSSHMLERTGCVNRFAEIYGYMPLLASEWRADPVLYRNDAVSQKLKKFQDVGTL